MKKQMANNTIILFLFFNIPHTPRRFPCYYCVEAMALGNKHFNQLVLFFVLLNKAELI
jgi:hypothetical protein